MAFRQAKEFAKDQTGARNQYTHRDIDPDDDSDTHKVTVETFANVPGLKLSCCKRATIGNHAKLEILENTFKKSEEPEESIKDDEIVLGHDSDHLQYNYLAA